MGRQQWPAWLRDGEGVSSSWGDKGENWKGKRSARSADSHSLPPTLSLLFLSEALLCHIGALFKRKNVGRLFAMLSLETPE